MPVRLMERDNPQELLTHGLFYAQNYIIEGETPCQFFVSNAHGITP